MQWYYVYVYLDPRRKCDLSSFEFEPFYVGKGSGDRKNFHLNNYGYTKSINPHKFRRIKNIQESENNVIVKNLCENLEEDEAYKREREIIDYIGRSINNRGPLTNIAEGGRGISGQNSLDLTNKEINTILSKYQDKDIPVSKIVGNYDISHNTLSRIRKHYNIKKVERRPPNYVEFSEEDREYIVKQYENEFITDRELSEKLNVSRTAVKKVLKEENVEFHSRKDYIEAGKIDPPNLGYKVNKNIKNQILKIYKETGNVKKACRKVNMEDQYSMIYNRLNKDRRGPTWVETR